MNMPDGIWMIRHYSYDGAGRHDQDDVRFYWTYEEAKAKLTEWANSPSFSDWKWEFDGEDDHNLVRRSGKYGYNMFFIQHMAQGEDID